MHSTRYDMALTGWIADSGDPGSFLDALLSPGSIPDRNAPSAMSANMSRWRSDEVVRRLAAYHDDPTPEKCNAVLDLVRDEVPLLPLAYGPSVTVTAWRVRNFRDHPLAISPVFAELELDDAAPSRARAPSTR